MANLRGEFKRGYLRSLYLQTNAGGSSQPGQTLIVVLNAFTNYSFIPVKSGALIDTSSQPGQSIKLQVASLFQTLSKDEVFALAEEFQAVYADALITLSANGNASPSDTDIFNTMMADDRLQSVTRTRTDYTTLPYPYQGGF